MRVTRTISGRRSGGTSPASSPPDTADRTVRLPGAQSRPGEASTALAALKASADALRREHAILTRAWRSAEANLAHARRLLELVPEGYLATDANGVIQDANFTACTLLHTPAHYLAGRPLILYVAPDLRPPLRRWLARGDAEGPFRKWFLRLQPRSGAPFDAALTVIVARDRRGHVARMHWIVRDATADGPAGERSHRLPADLTPLVRARTPVRALSQLSRHELLAHVHALHAVQARAAEGTQLIVRLQAITAALAEARTPDQVAAVIVDRGAQALGAAAASMNLLSDDGTAVALVHAVGIPEGVRRRWRQFPLSAPTAVTQVIRTGAPIFPDPDAAAPGDDPLLLGVQTILRDRVWTVLPLLSGRHSIGALVFILPEGRGLTKDERSFTLNLAHLGAQALERARLQEREIRSWAESERLQKTLLNAIAHDLKTPLTTVQGCLDTVLTEGHRLEPAARRELLTIAHQGVKRFARLVTGVLQMRRLETGIVQLRRAPANLADVVQEAVEEASGKQDRARCRVDLPDGLPLIPMDPLLVSHVLINLLDNAVKYSAPQTPIDVGAHVEDGHVVVSIADQGNGVSPEHLNQVFLASGHPNGPLTSDRARGSGLGLTIARGFVEAHQGRIWAARREGGGLVVNVSLPIA